MTTAAENFNTNINQGPLQQAKKKIMITYKYII
jgi:hypothetical protein